MDEQRKWEHLYSNENCPSAQEDCLSSTADEWIFCQDGSAVYIWITDESFNNKVMILYQTTCTDSMPGQRSSYTLKKKPSTDMIATEMSIAAIVKPVADRPATAALNRR